MCWSNYKLNSSSLWSVHHKSQWYDLLISSFQPSDHGRSKRSGWSGFGRTSFHGQFWNCACADNEQWITRWGRSYNLLSTCAYTPHALSAPKYSWYSYLGTATATGSITDSTAPDDMISGTPASELKASQAHIWAKIAVSPVLGLASGKG